MEIISLSLTFLAGIFILMGGVFALVFKDNKKVLNYSTAITFGVLISLIFFELFPEINHHLNEHWSGLTKYGIFVLFLGLGMLLIQLLDRFVPHHDHEEHGKNHHHNKKCETNKLMHIGVVSSLALVIHNIVEGMAIYSSVLAGVEMGILVSIGVGLHNIPIGIMLATIFYKDNKSKKKTLLTLFYISLSTLFGGLIMLLLNNLIPEFILVILLILTLGMLLYIVVFELLRELLSIKDKKTIIIGVISGICIFLISLLFHTHTH